MSEKDAAVCPKCGADLTAEGAVTVGVSQLEYYKSARWNPDSAGKGLGCFDCEKGSKRGIEYEITMLTCNGCDSEIDYDLGRDFRTAGWSEVETDPTWKGGDRIQIADG